MLIRHLIFFLVAQYFTWLMARGIIWQFAAVRPLVRRSICGICFLLCNGIFALLLLKSAPVMFRIGTLWLVLLLFVFFTMMAVRLLDLLLKPLGQPEKNACALRIFAPLMLMGLFAAAVYNAYTPTVRRAEITIAKPLPQPVRIGLVSDTHLGRLFGKRQLALLTDIMQREQPDMILMPGDIMDDDTVAYEAENMQPALQKLRAPLGVYATIGNHDVGYGRKPQDETITRALEAAGITVLTNRAVKAGGIWIVGLPDQMKRKGRQRAEVVLRQTNPTEPVFLLDHRPDDIPAHAQLPIDVQVSGHTHNGQVFPANLLVRMINTLHYGHARIGNGHFFVTSGYGFWGVPFRLGSQSEVWIIDVKGRQH